MAVAKAPVRWKRPNERISLDPPLTKDLPDGCPTCFDRLGSSVGRSGAFLASERVERRLATVLATDVDIDPRASHAMTYLDRIRVAACDVSPHDPKQSRDRNGGIDDRVFKLESAPDIVCVKAKIAEFQVHLRTEKAKCHRCGDEVDR